MAQAKLCTVVMLNLPTWIVSEPFSQPRKLRAALRDHGHAF